MWLCASGFLRTQERAARKFLSEAPWRSASRRPARAHGERAASDAPWTASETRTLCPAEPRDRSCSNTCLRFCSVDHRLHVRTSFRARPSALASQVTELVCRQGLGHSSPGTFLWQLADAQELGGRLLFHGLLDLLAGLRMERRKGRRPKAGKWNLQLGDRTSLKMRAREGMTGRRHSMAVGLGLRHGESSVFL